MRLNSGCAVRGGIGNRTFEQLCCYALATTTRADDSHDAPYRQVVDGPYETRVGRPRDLRAGTDVAPSHRFAVPVGHNSRRVVTLAQVPHGLLSASIAELLDLRGLQPVGQAPTMVGTAVAVDDVSEVLKAV
jgi:hypothetical protein